jgi:hypothetical protein
MAAESEYFHHEFARASYEDEYDNELGGAIWARFVALHFPGDAGGHVDYSTLLRIVRAVYRSTDESPGVDRVVWHCRHLLAGRETPVCVASAGRAQHRL